MEFQGQMKNQNMMKFQETMQNEKKKNGSFPSQNMMDKDNCRTANRYLGLMSK